MVFRDAVEKAVKLFGEKIVLEKRFVSILCDYHGFDTLKPAKTIIVDAIRLGYMEKLLSNQSGETKLASICYDFIQETGFKKEFVETVFSQISNVLHPKTSSLFNIDIPKRQLPFIFIVDASKNISDHTIYLINLVIEQFITSLSFLDEHPDVNTAFACMEYGNHAHWLGEPFCKFSEFKWKGLSRDGEGNIAEAFILLKDTFNHYFQNKSLFQPIIILISASKTIGNYETALLDLKKSDKLKFATRIGIYFDDSCDMTLLKDFASSIEHIVDYNNLEKLADWIVQGFSMPDLPDIDEPISSSAENSRSIR